MTSLRARWSKNFSSLSSQGRQNHQLLNTSSVIASLILRSFFNLRIRSLASLWTKISHLTVQKPRISTWLVTWISQPKSLQSASDSCLNPFWFSITVRLISMRAPATILKEGQFSLRRSSLCSDKLFGLQPSLWHTSAATSLLSKCVLSRF